MIVGQSFVQCVARRSPHLEIVTEIRGLDAERAQRLAPAELAPSRTELGLRQERFHTLFVIASQEVQPEFTAGPQTREIVEHAFRVGSPVNVVPEKDEMRPRSPARCDVLHDPFHDGLKEIGASVDIADRPD